MSRPPIPEDLTHDGRATPVAVVGISRPDSTLIPLTLPQFIRTEQQSSEPILHVQPRAPLIQTSFPRWSGKLNPPIPIGSTASTQTTTSTVAASGYDAHHSERQSSIDRSRAKTLLSNSKKQTTPQQVLKSCADKLVFPTTDGMCSLSHNRHASLTKHHNYQSTT